MSYSSVRAPGDVVDQPDHVGALLAAWPNIITAAPGLTVVMLLAVTDVELLPVALIVPGATSKGVAPEISTPVKATMAPAPLFVPVPRVKM